jgi:uncharacterized protein YbbC (DUF1343 family)
MDGPLIATRINEWHLQGVTARPVSFKPVEGKYAGHTCQGVMLHVDDPAVFRPVRYGWSLICLAKQLHPEAFSWAAYPTYVNHSGARHLDLLTGIPGAESLPGSIQDIAHYTGAGDWQKRMAPYLLYR